MTKFESARAEISMLEAATSAVFDKAFSMMRYEYEYVTLAEDEDTDWYNDEWVEKHLNEKGHEVLELAKKAAAKIEKLL